MTYYTVGIQRWRLPIIRKYRVVDHFWSDDETKLTIVDISGAAHSFPHMDKRHVIIFGDYVGFKKLKEAIPAPALPAPEAAPAAAPVQDVPRETTEQVVETTQKVETLNG